MEPQAIFIHPDDPPPPDGTPRRIEHIRNAVAEGDDPYERILTRYAAQVLLGEIDRLTQALADARPDKVYLLRQDFGERLDYYPCSAHASLPGAVAALNALAGHYQEPVDSITDDGLPSTTGQTVYISAMDLGN